MKIQIAALTFGKAADVYWLLWIKAQPGQRILVRDRRDEYIAVVFEPYESAVEQMIRIRREQETVLTVQPFLVV